MKLPHVILVATDFSDQADKAVDYAVELARKLDAKVRLIHGFVVPTLPGPESGLALPPDMIETMERDCKHALEQTVKRYHGSGVSIEATLKWEDPRHAVVDAAKELKADLIVIGTHGRKGLKRALLGSVAESVVRNAPCPVLTVR